MPNRKLIEILTQYDTNQYVVSTHSPELISAINPDIIHRVFWDAEAGQSKVEQMCGASLDDMALLLNDLGAKLSDVFGADYVIWVEGQTEEAAFPSSQVSALSHRLLAPFLFESELPAISSQKRVMLI